MIKAWVLMPHTCFAKKRASPECSLRIENEESGLSPIDYISSSGTNSHMFKL
jgi:hypothetical protein